MKEISMRIKSALIALAVALEIAIGGMQLKSFAANPRVPKTGRGVAADDETFAPTAKISAPVGKGGKNEKQDVLLVKRLLSKFGYKLALNGEADAALVSAIANFQSDYMQSGKPDGRIDPGGQ